jgi:hypothetical protein
VPTVKLMARNSLRRSPAATAALRSCAGSTGLITAGVIVGCALSIWLGAALAERLLWTTPPASVYNPPIYPNSGAVKLVTIAPERLKQLEMFNNGKELTFETGDEP